MDAGLSVGSALEALLDNGSVFGYIDKILHFLDIEAAPVWDSAEQDYVGMLSMNDFVVLIVELIQNTQVRVPDCDIVNFEPLLQDLKKMSIEQAFRASFFPSYW